MSSSSFPTEAVAEGKVEVVVPKLKAFVSKPSDYAPSKAPVFYNPVMELNRDLAVLAVQAFQRTFRDKMSICEPLAGCGVRGVRFAREVDGVEKVVVNDINREAYKLAKLNVEKNEAGSIVSLENEDAHFLLSRFGAPKKRFASVDIDPFGSPMPYVDSALRALRSDGLLALTATDLTSLCGIYPKVCVRRYCGMPLRTEYCHELAIRLLAGALAKAGARYDVGVNVIFSHYSEHYIRLYAVVTSGAKKANASLRSMGYVHHCFACFHREVVREMFQCKKACPECGENTAIAGPLWLDKIANRDFVVSMEMEARSRAFRGKRSIRKLLALIREEADAPVTHYVVDAICDKMGLPVPSVETVVERLRKVGSEACLTHFHPCGFRTRASAGTVTKIITELVRA